MSNPSNQPRGAMQVLPEIRGGALVKEISQALLDMAQAVEANQKAGKITLTLNFKPGSGAENAVVLVDSLKVTLPKPTERGTIFFADSKGSLTRNDPNQLELQGITVVRHAPKPADEAAA
jgi:hypothetical protein